MSYKIKSTEVVGDTLNTIVEYTFKDGSVQEITISHFMPATKEDVIVGIKNREVSEQRRIDAEKQNKILKAELDKEINDNPK